MTRRLHVLGWSIGGKCRWCGMRYTGKVCPNCG